MIVPVSLAKISRCVKNVSIFAASAK